VPTAIHAAVLKTEAVDFNHKMSSFFGRPHWMRARSNAKDNDFTGLVNSTILNRRTVIVAAAAVVVALVGSNKCDGENRDYDNKKHSTYHLSEGSVVHVSFSFCRGFLLIHELDSIEPALFDQTVTVSSKDIDVIARLASVFTGTFSRRRAQNDLFLADRADTL